MKISISKKIKIFPERLFLISVNIALVFLFVFRYIPSSLDDENYLYHFSMQPSIRSAEFLASEAIYSGLTYIFSSSDGFFGVRLLIASGLVFHFICQVKLKGIQSWLYLVGYYSLPNLAILYSYTQLRYGLALGIAALFLCIDSEKNKITKPLLLFFAAGIHVGFIVLIPIYFASIYLYKKNKLISKSIFIEIIFLALIIYFSFYAMNSLQSDMRFDQYQGAGLNFFGILQYSIPIFVFSFLQYAIEKKISFETFLTSVLGMALIALHFFGIAPDALPRLFNVSFVFLIISALKVRHASNYGVIFCCLLYLAWILVSLGSPSISMVFADWANIA